MGGRGVVSFISNYSWTSEPSYVVLRERLLKNFDKFWIENMHGNRNISEYAPDGKSSQTVFAQDGFSPGIRQGVVISTWVKTGKPDLPKQVLYCDSFNQSKAANRRQALLISLEDPKREAMYVQASPMPENRLTFKPSDVGSAFATWPTLTELAGEAPINGLMEKRGGALIDFDKARLDTAMRLYFDSSVELRQVVQMRPELGISASGYEPAHARNKVLAAEVFKTSNSFGTAFAHTTPGGLTTPL